ncbi:MAG: type VI secretion system-associated FHA domain protein TagH [Beijerinckiaceae bacterium]
MWSLDPVPPLDPIPPPPPGYEPPPRPPAAPETPAAPHGHEPDLVPAPAMAIPVISPASVAPPPPGRPMTIPPEPVPELPRMPPPAPSVMPTPEPPPVPAPAPPPMPRAAGFPDSGSDFIARFARSAGLPEDIVRSRDAGALADLLGLFVRLTADNLRQLHAARAQSKGAMRSANVTMIQLMDNNPLRFSPTTDDALRILFGPPTKSYLDAPRTLDNSFADLKKHQLQVFSAMQTALRQLLDDLDPKSIEGTVPADKGVGALLRSREARLWDHYQTTWKARAGTSEHGMLDVFMRLFADAYDKA